MRGRIKFEWGVKLQGTEANEANERLRERTKEKVQRVLRGEIKCIRVKITCEEWKNMGKTQRDKKLRRKKENGQSKRCRYCPREKIKHMKKEKK